MRRSFSVLLAVFLLAACSSMTDGATQDITIETPGTGDAICTLDRPGYASRVWAPKTVKITKSSDPMVVTCRAPGNREKKVVVHPDIPTSFYVNLANGLLPGAAYDYSTGAMYKYPEKIVVDFTDMKPQKMPVPDYQQVLDQNPDVFDMEEWRPGAAALQRDRDYLAPELKARRTDQEIFSGGDLNAVHTGEESVSMGTAGTPAPYEAPPVDATASPAAQSGSGSTADQLTRKMNPQVFSAGGMSGGTPVIGAAPVELHPAQ